MWTDLLFQQMAGICKENSAGGTRE